MFSNALKPIGTWIEEVLNLDATPLYWFDFEEASGNLTNNGDAEKLTTLVVQSTPLYSQTGAVGDAVTYDSTTDEHHTGGMSAGEAYSDSGFSLILLYKTTDASASWMCGWAKNFDDDGHFIRSWGDDIQIHIQDAVANDYNVVTNTNWGHNDGNFHCVVITFDYVNKPRVYADGVEQTTDESGDTSLKTYKLSTYDPNEFDVCNRTAVDSSDTFTGTYDELVVMNGIVLTEAQALTLSSAAGTV